MPTKRVAGKKKLKSIKAKLTDGMGSKRRLAKFGKEQRKGMKGSAANYITRSQALKKLQVTLKDFRRLCILKGVYPREPKKKPSGKDKTYYYLKDVMYLAHEPILDKFREFKTFMKKVKKAMGKRDYEDARRKHDNRPVYSLDHIVKERYPRFIDALGDLDDALCLVHLFAMMPAGKGVDAAMTENCLRLVREWNNYVATTRSLTKVFVSIKGIYYQANVQGQTITWLVPHQFTPTMDKRVDVRVMLTFLEFYEVLLKFVNFQLYTDLGIAYPPKINLQLDQAGAQLSALQLERAEKEAEKNDDGEHHTSEEDEAPKEVTKQQKESEKRIKTLAKTLGATAFDDEEEDGDDAQHAYGELSEPLEAAFASNKLATQIYHEQQKEASEKSLFSGLFFFLSREVPAACLELVLRSHGAQIGWDGVGSPFTEKDERITHHIMDRPHQGHRYFNREYVQPQWVFDSVNNGMLLPLARYVPGADLPPHLSPFVDDSTEGYTPEYRKQLNKLKSATQVLREVGDLENADEDESEDEEETYAAGLKAELDGKAATEAGSDEEDEDDDDDEAEDKSEDDEEEKPENSQKRKAAEDASSTSGKKSKKAKREEEEKELHEMATNMMSKKAKRLYDRMQFGLGKKADKIQALEDKRVKLEEEKAAAAAHKTQDAPAKKKKGKKGKKQQQ